MQGFILCIYMKKIDAVLFDFDGVITDTEPQYEIYFNDLAKRYKLNIRDFASLIRGVTLPNMLDIYFSDYSEGDKNTIIRETALFEQQMDFKFIPGAEAFIKYLKENGYKTALVTSSPEAKMTIALSKMELENTFDTVVTANQITKGKPDPMCYLLAAGNLNRDPSECIVFEDSLAGIAAAKNAKMKIIGLSTTFPKEELKKHVNDLISDFSDLEKVISFL